MKATLKKFIKLRIIILLIFLIISLIAINPQLSTEGAAIKYVIKGSPAESAGITTPKTGISPTHKEIIKYVNNIKIKDVKDYYEKISLYEYNTTLTIRTNKNVYRVVKGHLINQITANTSTDINETMESKTNESNIESNITKSFSKEILNESLISKIYGITYDGIGIIVENPASTNIKKGLDLAGGARVVLEPEHKVSKEDIDIVESNIRERLNAFGLKDIVVRRSADFEGNSYIIIEMAGVNKEEIRNLVSSQGKFEAKIGNETVFKGENDIIFVCRSSECSGLDSRFGCQEIEAGTTTCKFNFQITLSEKAAAKQAQITKNLDVIVDQQGGYLSKKLDLFLDDQLVDQLSISAELKGKAVTDILITGSGVGANYQEALENTLNNMKRLQTILITGSLPVKMNIVKTDSLSPLLGTVFLKNIMFIALLSILSVALILFIKFRTLKVSIPIIITLCSEIVIILGFASLIGWNLDIAAIAGIIIAIGTGVDHQIVIADETLRGETRVFRTWKERIKMAFFIIFLAYLTTVLAMLPLIFTGAGMLKGFALTTIAGISIGILITRPAFASIIEILLSRKDDEE